jgi:hypothetical protein
LFAFYCASKLNEVRYVNGFEWMQQYVFLRAPHMGKRADVR